MINGKKTFSLNCYFPDFTKRMCSSLYFLSILIGCNTVSLGLISNYNHTVQLEFSMKVDNNTDSVMWKHRLLSYQGAFYVSLFVCKLLHLCPEIQVIDNKSN